MYNSIDKYISSGHHLKALINYDIKNESPDNAVLIEHNPLEKYRKYKSKNDGFDCDKSDMVFDVYKKLFGCEFRKNEYNRVSLSFSDERAAELSKNWGGFSSDTMNSVGTVYYHAVNNIFESRFAAGDNRLLNEYTTFAYTIGNFVPVPLHLSPDDKKSFNQCRGYRHWKNENRTIEYYSPYYVCDFFDLSLQLIKEHSSEAVFRQYIDLFLLNDYVDENYNVLPLIESHKKYLKKTPLDISNPDKFLPKTKKELYEYLENAIRLIKSRGKRMIAALSRFYPDEAVPESYFRTHKNIGSVQKRAAYLLTFLRHQLS